MVARVALALMAVFWSCICAEARREKIQVRLEGGPQPYAGRVMVYYKFRGIGVWGSICDNGWSKKSAAVVCRQLGYKGVVLATKGKFYGRQKLYETIRFRSRRKRMRSRIWLDRIVCHGDEWNLGECRKKPWGQVRCNRERLAGVMCDPGLEKLIKKPPLHNVTKNIDINKFKLSLLPKSKRDDGIVTEGVLMVKYEGNKKGVVCSDGWSLKESRVACGELGFTHAVETKVKISINQLRTGKGFHLGDVKCTGNEASLLSCDSSGLHDQPCKSGMFVWLKCETKVPTFAHARLRGGVHKWEGRAEVRKRNDWATLCDKDLDIYTANVICRSLGYGTAKEYALGSVYPHAMEIMKQYEKITCSGKETFLQNCLWHPKMKGRFECRHYSDAGVRCNVPKIIQKDRMQIRLARRTHRRPDIGRVDVMLDGQWGNICGERWTMKNSIVVCRQLGFGYAVSNYSTLSFGKVGKIVMSGVTCLGHETSLDQCLRHNLNNVTCGVTRVAGVLCSKVAPDLVWDIQELAKTMGIAFFPKISLQCAYEENCLASSAKAQFESTTVEVAQALYGHQRRLLRFSAKVHNVGTAAYRPYQARNAWIWHTCHRHYHSDEEFAFYDLIDPHTHKKVAEGHKASYCLEDTKCDDGVDPFYDCDGGGDQGISVNCHDDYSYELDCQWVDVTDLLASGRSYKLRLVANPALKVGESDYSNNVVLCDVTDRRRYVQVGECHIEKCESGVRSHFGNGNFACCRFPFIYDGKSHDTCVLDEKTRRFWCATSKNFDQDKLFGYC